jgi:hypothetical protein
MKGPYERLKYDLRRLWECPVCKRRERTAGSVTSRLCLCQMKHADGKPVVMKLVEDGPQRVAPPVAIKPAAAEQQQIDPAASMAVPNSTADDGAGPVADPGAET